VLRARNSKKNSLLLKSADSSKQRALSPRFRIRSRPKRGDQASSSEVRSAYRASRSQYNTYHSPSAPSQHADMYTLPKRQYRSIKSHCAGSNAECPRTAKAALFYSRSCESCDVMNMLRLCRCDWLASTGAVMLRPMRSQSPSCAC
jgi:hypothetical protein